MKAFNVTFEKKNGELREMNFVKIKDLSDDFLEWRIKGDREEVEKRKLPKGMRLVFDIDKDDFRILNKKTIVGKIKKIKIKRSDYGY